MNRHIFYGGLTFSCLTGMAINTYKRDGFNNIKDFFFGMFHESNIIFVSILGALQVKCFDAILDKYIEK